MARWRTNENNLRNQYGGFMLDVHWFSGLMLCICNLYHFVCDSP